MKRVIYSITTLKPSSAKNREMHDWAKLWKGYEFPTAEDFSDWLERLRNFVKGLNEHYKHSANLSVIHCDDYQHVTVCVAGRLDSDIVRIHNCKVPYTYQKKGGKE